MRDRQPAVRRTPRDPHRGAEEIDRAAAADHSEGSMIRTTPFHDRTSAANVAGLWEHWSGYLVAQKYQLSEKFEYFAIRNSAGLFDSSPLYKYRIHGPDAEAFLAGVLARDIRTCAVGHGQYTAWLDDRGFVVEDGVIFRMAADAYLLTCAEPNQAYFSAFIGRQRVTIEDVSEASAVLSIQGPKSREILSCLTPAVADLPYFGLASATIGGADVTISRTGFTGDLGYELWIPAAQAVAVWDVVADASAGRGVIPFGLVALSMARIEAGLLLLDVDFGSSRFAWTDANRSTLVEIGLGWMVRGLANDDRRFIGRAAVESELRDKTSRWKLTGLVLDWQDYDRHYDEAGLIPPKDHTPMEDEYYVYDDAGTQLGYATSLMYSPMLQRHIALARVPLDRTKPGSRVKLELPVNHRYEYFDAAVSRLPLYNPDRRTA
ncbi:MAG: aminomethyltransferase family protein [Chloroflexota bacterium]|nr:aminomethyltransferase family protein [Chloroflexota bacterium]